MRPWQASVSGMMSAEASDHPPGERRDMRESGGTRCASPPPLVKSLSTQSSSDDFWDKTSCTPGGAAPLGATTRLMIELRARVAALRTTNDLSDAAFKTRTVAFSPKRVAAYSPHPPLDKTCRITWRARTHNLSRWLVLPCASPHALSSALIC